MEKHDVILSAQTTPALWHARDSFVSGAIAFTPSDGWRLGAERSDGSHELIREVDGAINTSSYTDLLVSGPDGRQAKINFHGERTTHSGNLSLEEAEAIMQAQAQAQANTE